MTKAEFAKSTMENHSRLIGELRFEDDADNVRYDETSQKIYVGFGSGGIAVVNAPTENRSAPLNSAHIPKLFSWRKREAEFSSMFPTRVMSR